MMQASTYEEPPDDNLYLGIVLTAVVVVTGTIPVLYITRRQTASSYNSASCSQPSSLSQQVQYSTRIQTTTTIYLGFVLTAVVDRWLYLQYPMTLCVQYTHNVATSGGVHVQYVHCTYCTPPEVANTSVAVVKSIVIHRYFLDIRVSAIVKHLNLSFYQIRIRIFNEKC